MSSIFNVNGLYKHISSLYGVYMQLDKNSAKEVDKLRRIAANLDLCNIVRERDCIAVAGMQGTGKTTLIKNLYGFPDNILKTSVERGEAVPVFITESSNITEGSYKAVRRYIDDNGTIKNEDLDISNFAYESGKRDDTVCVELFTSVKYFSKSNSSFVLLPGFEKTTREELDKAYNSLMNICLNFSKAILLVVDEQNIANADIDVIIDVIKKSGFDNTNSVFAITKCDDPTKNDSFKTELKETFLQILTEHHFSVNQANVVCTGKFNTQEENDEWIEEIIDALNRSERPRDYELFIECYGPIIEEIKESAGNIKNEITDLQLESNYEKHSPLYDDLIEQKEESKKRMEGFLEGKCNVASEKVEKNIKDTFEHIPVKMLKDKRFIFKKKLETRNRDEEEIQRRINECFISNETKEPILYDNIRSGLSSGNIEKTGLLELPAAQESSEELMVLENENKQKILEYYFNPKALTLPLDLENRELIPDTKKESKILADSLTAYFVGAAIQGEYKPDIKTSSVSKLAKEIKKQNNPNASKKVSAGAAATIGLDMIDGVPHIAEMISAGLATPAGPYVAAALAVAAVTAGGIILHNKSIDLQVNTQEAAIRSAKYNLQAQCEKLLNVYESGFDNMINEIEAVYREKKKVGAQQTALMNAGQALTEIDFICQDYYDSVGEKLRGE